MNIYSFACDFLDQENNLTYLWNEQKSELKIPKLCENGFDIIVGEYEFHIYLMTDRGYHDHWHSDRFENIEVAYQIIFGLVWYLLSLDMRILEKRSNNSPYCWLLQSCVEGKWRTESKTALILWNYFGKRSELVFSNDSLPKRGFS